MNILEVKERLEIIKSKIIERGGLLPDSYKDKDKFISKCIGYCDDFDMSDLSDDSIRSELVKLREKINSEMAKYLNMVKK